MSTNQPKAGQFMVVTPNGSYSVGQKSFFDSQQEAEEEVVKRLSTFPGQLLTIVQVVKTMKASVSVTEVEDSEDGEEESRPA